MTDIELLKNVIDSLDRINIPIGLTEQIGIPIVKANNQLKALYDYIVKQVVKAPESDEEAEEIKMEVSEET